MTEFFTSRWNSIKKITNAVSADDHPADPSLHASQNAEVSVMERASQSNCWIQQWSNIRIPFNNTLYEIDCLLLSSTALIVIEVKNWSGYVSINTDSWEQRRRDGSIIRHSNPIILLRKKIDAVLLYLRLCNDGTVDIEKIPVYGRILFVNKNCVLSGEISDIDEVVDCRHCDALLNNQHITLPTNLIFPSSTSSTTVSSAAATITSTAPASTLYSIVSWAWNYIHQNSITILSTATQSLIISAIATLRTWDVLYLYGGRIITGDYVCLQPKITDLNNSIQNFCNGSFVRNEIGEVKFSHYRGYFWASVAVAMATVTSQVPVVRMTAYDRIMKGLFYPSTSIHFQSDISIDSYVVFHTPDTHALYHSNQGLSYKPTMSHQRQHSIGSYYCFNVNDVEKIIFSKI